MVLKSRSKKTSDVLQGKIKITRENIARIWSWHFNFFNQSVQVIYDILKQTVTHNIESNWLSINLHCLLRTYYRSYSPSYPGYPADTRMLWRIVYVTNSGALIPSPVWGFQTRACPDFKVEKILVPPNAFSGLTFDVSWTVRNIGKVGNVLRTWYDAVLIGKSTDSRSARFVIIHIKVYFRKTFLCNSALNLIWISPAHSKADIW